jgi:hypothetical protein
MAKRIQVILQDSDWEIRLIARSRGMSIAQWVRGALELARREDLAGSVAKKLAVLRAAAQHNFPTVDIDTMICGD